MRLRITNVGKIRHADLEFNGITLVAGVNNSGKSAVSKSLYYISSCFCGLRRRIERIRIDHIVRALCGAWDWPMAEGDKGALTQIAESLVRDRDSLKGDAGKLASELEELYRKSGLDMEDKSVLKRIVEEVEEALRVGDDRIKAGVFQNGVDSEFEGQINNVFSDGAGKIQLSVGDRDYEISFSENRVVGFASSDAKGFGPEPVYIDDPFVLDGDWRRGPRCSASSGFDDHRTCLRTMLRRNKNKDILGGVIAAGKLERIHSKIRRACPGDFVLTKEGRGEYREGGGKAISAGNLSMGLRSFIILKTLLENGCLQRNGIVIMDEPENHLHPEWQLLYAELIVLIQKEFNLRMLLNTHSPYFFHAVRVCSEKLGIADNCKYYLSSNDEEGSALIQDVTGSKEQIYARFSKPFSDLEEEWQEAVER